MIPKLVAAILYTLAALILLIFWVPNKSSFEEEVSRGRHQIEDLAHF